MKDFIEFLYKYVTSTNNLYTIRDCKSFGLFTVYKLIVEVVTLYRYVSLNFNSITVNNITISIELVL